MPGILGIVGKHSPLTEIVFSEMLSRGRMQPWHTQVSGDLSLGDEYAAFAQTGLGILEKDHPPIAKTPKGNVTVVVCGEFFNSRELQAILGKDAIFSLRGENHDNRDVSPAEIILTGYLFRGRMFFELIDGRFHAAIFDSEKKRIILTCDRFGTRPLYWTQTPQQLLFASEIKTLLADETVSRQADLRGIVNFFSFGHYFGQETSLKSVSVLPPAAWFSYSTQQRVMEREIYWKPWPVTRVEAEKVSVPDVADAFHAAVRRQTDDTPGLGISLSGGLDARSVLGMIQHPEKVTSVALGVPGSADHELATQLAKLAGTTHYNYELKTDFLQNYESCLAEMVRLTDGQYLSSSIVIPTLPFYREKGIQTLLRGHAGELMHMSKAYAFSLTPAELRKLTTPDAVFQWASAHLQAYMLDGVDTPLLKGVTTDEFRESSQFALRAVLEDAYLEENEPPAQTLWMLYLRQRVFREIPLSMRKFDSQVNIRLPFLDNRLIDMLLALRPEQKMAEEIQWAILKKYRPDFLRVKNVNTGTYIGSGIIRQKLAGLKHKIYEKLGVPGYQPYEKMGLWLRRELSPLVTSLLLTDQALDGEIFEPDTVRKVVTEHFEGKNHTYLILAMMIFQQQMRFFESAAV